MFTLFKQPIDSEIELFISSKEKRSAVGAKGHRHVLRAFKSHSKMKACEDITIEHIRSYSKHLKSTKTLFTHQRHMETLRSFIRFHRHFNIKPDWITAYGIDDEAILLFQKEKEYILYPMTQVMRANRKVERNRELVLKRKKDPRKWSIGNLANHYGITKRAVWEIWHRDKDLYTR